MLASVVEWLASKLNSAAGSATIPSVVKSLSLVLRETGCRRLFLQHEGLHKIAIHMRAKTVSSSTTPSPFDVAAVVGVSGGNSKLDIQLLYECGLCVWLLSFENPQAFVDAPQVLSSLVQVICNVGKEKVVRVCVLALCNIAKDTAAELVGLGLPKGLENLKLQVCLFTL